MNSNRRRHATDVVDNGPTADETLSSNRGCRRLRLSPILWVCTAFAATGGPIGAGGASGGQITVGDPTASGRCYIYLTKPDGTSVISLAVIDVKANEGAATKLADIQGALKNNPRITVDNVAANGSLPYTLTDDSYVLNIRGPAGDPGLLLDGMVPAGSFVDVGFSGALTGVSPSGGVATYSATIYDDSFRASTTVSYDDLATKTIAGLLGQMYSNLESQLPARDRANLSVDFANGVLVYRASATSATLGVLGDSEDAGTECIVCAYTSVPEPASAVMLGTGVVLLGCAKVRHRNPKGRRETTRPEKVSAGDGTRRASLVSASLVSVQLIRARRLAGWRCPG